ncbi:hypothetical protein [Sphaerisporangium sp. NPDC051011]|uniref:hypothetical protein n=1 Tax=Sphaerisporangium sp. NPDC051011 TaxID=3155792 RepID=UPI0033E3ED39
MSRPSPIRALLSRALAVRALILMTGERDLARQQRDAAQATNRDLRAALARRDGDLADLRDRNSEQAARHDRLLDDLATLRAQEKDGRLNAAEVVDGLGELMMSARARQELHLADGYLPVEALDDIHTRIEEGGL